MSSHCEKGKHCTKLCKQEHGLEDVGCNPGRPSTGTAPAGTRALLLGLIPQQRCKVPREVQERAMRINRGLKRDQRRRTE